MGYLASKASDADLKNEIDFFNTIDENKDGYITKKELKKGLKNYPNIDKKLIATIMSSLDTENIGAISYNEFIAAVLNDGIAKDYGKIAKAFQFFNKDDNGFITDKQLKETLAGSEFRNLDTKIFTDAINEVGHAKNGEIKMKDFMRLMSVHFENSFQSSMQMSTVSECIDE